MEWLTEHDEVTGEEYIAVDTRGDALLRDPAYGARPLKRTLQRRVLDALAMRILEGEFVEGDTVTVEALADGLRFEKRPAVAA